MKPMYLCDACLETWYTNQARHEGYGVCQRCHGGNRKLSYIYYASDLDRHRFETQQRLERSVYTTARRIAKWLVIRSSSYVHLATAITRDQEWMTLEVDEATPHATPSGKDQAT